MSKEFKVKHGLIVSGSIQEDGATLVDKYLGISSKAANSDLLDSQSGEYYLNYPNFTNTPTIPTVYNSTITVSGSNGLIGVESFTTNQSSNETINIQHADTSTLTGTYGGDSIASITVDGLGHVTVITTGSGGGASVEISDSPPVSTTEGALWINPLSSSLYAYYDNYWFQVVRDGEDGTTPHIGENNNWFIGETDTGVLASGSNGADGDDAELISGSIHYSLLSNQLIGTASDNDGNFDFASAGIISSSLTSNTSITFSNLQTNKTLKIKLQVTNSAAIDFPSYCKPLSGWTNPSGSDGVYYAYFDCWSSTSGNELVLMSITQEAE